MVPGWYGGSTAALGWDGRSLRAAGWNELRSSRLRLWEVGASLRWRNSSTTNWDRGSSMALGCEAWRSPRWSDAVPVFRGRRELCSSGLRWRELGESRLKIDLGGSRLRRKKHRLFRPGMR